MRSPQTMCDIQFPSIGWNKLCETVVLFCPNFPSGTKLCEWEDSSFDGICIVLARKCESETNLYYYVYPGWENILTHLPLNRITTIPPWTESRPEYSRKGFVYTYEESVYKITNRNAASGIVIRAKIEIKDTFSCILYILLYLIMTIILCALFVMYVYIRCPFSLSSFPLFFSWYCLFDCPKC